VPESAARLARMVGRDAASAPEETWRRLACAIGQAQLRQLQDAAARVMSAAVLPSDAALAVAVALLLGDERPSNARSRPSAAGSSGASRVPRVSAERKPR